MSRIGAETGFLAKQSTIYGIGNLLQRATSLLLLPVYTHYLTTSDYGIKELVTITTDVVSVLVSTAVSMALYRIYFQYDDAETRRQVISSSYVAMAVAGALTLAVLLPFTGPLARLILDGPELGIYLTLSLAALWFQTMNRLSYDYMRAKQQAVRVVVFSVVRLALSLGLNIWFIVGHGMGVIGVLWSTLITAVVMFLIVTIPQVAQVGLRFSWPVMREMITFGGPLVWSQLGGMVVHLSDRFFIKAMISIQETGIYSLGYRLGTMSSMFVVEPFNQTFMARRFEIHKMPEHARIFGRIFSYYVGALIFFALVISVLARDLLRVMSDPAFWSAAAVVPIIAAANTTFALHYHLNFGLMVARKTRIMAAINLSNAAMVLGLNWLLIPRFGIFGAAYATLLGFVAKVCLTWYASRRYYRPEFETRRLIQLVGTAFSIYGVSRLVVLDGLVPSLAVNFGWVVAYPLVLWLTGFLHAGEKAKIQSVFRRVRRFGTRRGA